MQDETAIVDGLAKQKFLPLFNCGDAANLKAWCDAGVFCMGMSSSLVDAETLKTRRFADLSDRAGRLVSMLPDVSPV
jgi:2-keto-3-deoxy-6-phosphogluconate aldolase